MKALFHKKAALPVTISTRYHRYVHSHAIPYQPPEKPPQSQPPPPPPPLAMMPTGTLLRSLFFTSIMSSPLLNPCLAILGRVVNSNSPWLNPSQNPVVHHILRTTIYNHFCAGKNEVQVKQTVSGIKNLGFRGVILGYAKEVVVREYDGNSMSSRRDQEEANVQAVEGWKRGNLRTLKMIGKGDYLAIKCVLNGFPLFRGNANAIDSPALVHSLSTPSLTVTPCQNPLPMPCTKSAKSPQPRNPVSGSTLSSKSSNLPLTPGRLISCANITATPLSVPSSSTPSRRI